MDLGNKPKQADGSPFVSPCMFPSGVYLYLTGAGDHPTNGRGEGQEFSASRSAQGESELEWQFNDLMFLAGGGALFSGAAIGDWASLLVVAPATAITPNGGGTGNCNLINPPGILVPAAGDGAYDVDLDTAVPVPAITESGNNGYWEWDYPLVGRGTVSVGEAGKAHFHLVPAEVPLVRYACKIPILGEGQVSLTVPAVEPKAQLPHWKGKLRLHNHDGAHEVTFSFYLTTARAVTV